MKTATDQAPRLALLVLQPTAFCNLDCKYCYVPERSNAARMSEQTLRRTCDLVARSSLLQDQQCLELLWHAGEPLAAGVPFFRNAQVIFDHTLGARCRTLPTFQTNATLITSAWCDYFVESGAQVGVSLDGPKEIHDAQRSRRRGVGSFDQVMRGLDLLGEHGISRGALCVLTRASLAQPQRLFEFFIERQLFDVSFNVEETEGENARSSLSWNGGEDSIAASYAAFMHYFLAENERRGHPLVVREFLVQGGRLLSRARDPACLAPVEAENRLGEIITISRDGEIFSWSPELASGVNGNIKHFSLGNVHAVACLDEVLNSPRAREIQSQIDAGVERCRESCEFFGVCGGGLPSNKYYENKSFDSTETLRCRLHVQALTNVLLSHAQGTLPTQNYYC